MLIRDAADADLAEIVQIANALLSTTTIEWTEQPHTLDDRKRWLEQHHAKGDAVLVVEIDGAIEAFASYGDFRDATRWPGYRFTVEHTVHVRERSWGRGIGRRLMHALMARARATGKHVMVGGIDSDNLASLRFHERLGFVEVARMPEIGWKLDRWLSLVLMQHKLGHEQKTR